MLLAIDVGNTNIKLRVYDKNERKHSWRLSVKVVRTADEIGILFAGLFGSKSVDLKNFDGVIMSSVQPSLNYTIEHACEYYLGKRPIMVGVGIKTGLNIKYSNPQEVGADRIVNSVAAYKLYGGPCIVVDFGTATTFNVISPRGEFMGGCIAPGIITGLEALTNNTAKLPRVEIAKPDSIIAKSTVTGLQAGMVYGSTGMVKYILLKLKEESGYTDVKVIATGGLSEVILGVDDEKIIDVVDRSLTLKGLKLIYDMNI
ncbi:MAG: type III pantothenate kinase [Clostridia bacterium]|nr:type III pantothenate kinase [Clostridia bacterium]